MKKNSVGMGEYYNAAPYGLVRTVCRGYDHQSGESIIAYVNIETGGYASDVFMMSEDEFKNIFLN